ncbi:MAG: N-acetylmuramoyl-L-alanine amidase [Flavobacteriaceae bacterium]
MIKNLNLLLRNFVCLLFLLFANLFFSQIDNEKFTVVLDAGHGGKDPGNRGNGYYEKNIALSIALKIGAELEKRNDIKIIYTRKTDVFVDLFKRAQIANKAKADLFISIHCDAHNSNAYGAGTFVLGLHANQRNFEIAKKENSVIFKEKNYEQNYGGFNPNNPESVISLVLMQEEYLDQSIVAANLIQEFFTKNLKRKNRTVKQAGFIVLKYTYMPSVLVETGFLTNKNEGKYLNSKKGQMEMSSTIADAIIKYKKVVANSYSEFSSELINDDNINNTYLKIQIASSNKFLELKSYNFKGLTMLSYSYSKSRNSYKYYFENTQSYTQAKKYLLKAKRAGFKDAIIVAFDNGKKITLDQFLSRN